MRWSMLTASECGRGIIPVFSDEIEHHPDIEALTLDKGMRGTTMDKRIVATFTGKFAGKKDGPLVFFAHLKFQRLKTYQ